MKRDPELTAEQEAIIVREFCDAAASKVKYVTPTDPGSWNPIIANLSDALLAARRAKKAANRSARRMK